MDNSDLQILSVKETCRLINTSTATIYRWEAEGRLPFPKIRIGPNKVGFRRIDVDSYINDQVEKHIEPLELED